MNLRRLLQLLSACAFVAASPAMMAQERISVSGKVINKADGKPVTDVTVYGYNTYEEAKEALQNAENSLKNKTLFNAGYCIERQVDPTDGSYEPMTLPSDGAILFMYPSTMIDSKVEKIRGRSTVSVSFDLAVMLEEAVVSVKTKRPVLKKPTVKGNTLQCGAYWPFPEPRMGREDARFAVQTFVLDESFRPDGLKDTIEYHYPMVIDGKDYHDTQIRRKGYRASRDPLLAYADSSIKKYGWLSDTTSFIQWDDEYYIDNPNLPVVIRCKMWFEDYNKVYYRDSLKLADSRRVSRPMRFLEYNLKPFKLDAFAREYFREPRPVPMDDAKDMALKFLVGRAQLDESDSTTVAQMSELLGEIRTIVEGEKDGFHFHEYAVYGTSSPEGNYASNVHLAAERMAYIQRQIQAILHKKVYCETHSEVAGWDKLADILERDSLLTEARTVREIVEKNKSIDEQGRIIRVLPYYNTEIKPRLAELRSVKVVYKYELFRKRTPEEVLENFRAVNQQARLKFPTYEYWTLMQMIEEGKVPDVAEQEQIYRCAATITKLRDKNWQLPQNELARFLIAQDKADTTILAPYIFEDFRLEKADGTVLWCDRPFDGYIRNPSPLVANQVVMLIKAGKFERAAEIVEMLPRDKAPEYKDLYYITRCLAGYFDDDSAAGEELYDVICATSNRNAFVINLALGKYSQANLNLQEMDPKDPLTQYLSAQYLCQRYYGRGVTLYSGMTESDQKDAMKHLTRAFRMDKKYISIAETDFDIFEDLYKKAAEKYTQLDPEDLLPLDAENVDGMYFSANGLRLVFFAKEGEHGAWVELPEGWHEDFEGVYSDENYVPVDYVNGEWIKLQ